MAQPLEKPGSGGDAAHVAGDRLEDDAGDLALVGRSHRLDLVEVVVGCGQGVLGKVGRDAGGGRYAEGCQAAAGLDQQGVGVAVVAAVELEDLVAAGVAAGQADGAHGCFGSGRDHAHLLDVWIGFANHLGQLGFSCRWCAKGCACRGGFLDGLNDFRVAVAKYHRAPRADIIDIAVVVGVEYF